MKGEMRAGAGKEEMILEKEYLEIEEFAVIHRALNVRVIILEAGESFAFVSVEMTSLPAEETDQIRKQISDVLDIRQENIWVSCTHTFSAPHLLPDHLLQEDQLEKKAAFRGAIRDAAVKAAKKAQTRMTPVTPKYGSAYCDINVPRDVELEEGWWIGDGGNGLADHEVQILRLDNEEGNPVAVLFNYAVQSSVLDGSLLSAGGKAVSPDVAGTACAYIEQRYRKHHLTAVFTLGAAGDQIPVKRAVTETFVQGERLRTDKHEEGFKICESLGKKLGQSVCGAMERAGGLSWGSGIRVAKKSVSVPAKEMCHDLKKLHPVQELSYQETGMTTTEIEAAVVGELAIFGVKPELNCITAQAVRAMSPYRCTMVMTMVNGASKYMADKRSYDRFTYEAQNSPFAKGAAEIVLREGIRLLEKMYMNRFQVQKFTDAEGRELTYNLFIPEDYDPNKSYPLVLFLHDAGSCSDQADATLTQGTGATVWSLKKEQEKRPCFVVAPQFPEKCAEDDFTVGWEADAVIQLIESLRKKYSINKNRIYGTGQSMGCMILCDLNVRYPDFFGACFLVAGQWDPKIMKAAKHKNFWILVSEKDEKAFPIMGDCVKAMEAAGAKVSRGSWNARLPEEKQNEIVRQIAKAESNINFTWFEGDSVVPEGEMADFPGIYHVNTWGSAYGIEAVREWLFMQYRTLDFSAKSHILIKNEDDSLQPMDQPYFKAECVAPGTWQILSDGDYSYLVEGEEEAIVIDSGYGSGNIREFCQTLTDKPVKNIINTHDHFDHTANNSYFECAYMSEQSVPLATRPFKSFEGIRFPRDYDIHVVREGEVIGLGGRTLEVFEIPDHAVGSIALLDRKEKLLFCGDELCMPMGKNLNGTVERWKGYLEKLMLHRKDIHKLMGGPGICDAVLLDQMLENVNYILAGHEGAAEQLRKKEETEDGSRMQESSRQMTTIYDRRFPHPEDLPPHAGQPDPDARVMEYAGTRIIYKKNRVFEPER